MSCVLKIWDIFVFGSRLIAHANAMRVVLVSAFGLPALPAHNQQNVRKGIHLFKDRHFVCRSCAGIIFAGITYRIKPDELYILSCGKGRGRRPRPIPQLRMESSEGFI